MTRKLITIALIVLAVLAVYLGAYRPFVKSRAYISVRQAAPLFRTIDDLVAHYDAVFNYYSPIGDGEIAKFFSTNVLNSISQDSQPKEVTDALSQYMASYIVEDDAIQLLQVAYVYDLMWQLYGDGLYYGVAEAHYLRMHEIGPRLPHPLYGLFDLYQKGRELEKAREMGEKILELWPQDESVREFVEALD